MGAVRGGELTTRMVTGAVLSVLLHGAMLPFFHSLSSLPSLLRTPYQRCLERSHFSQAYMLLYNLVLCIQSFLRPKYPAPSVNLLLIPQDLTLNVRL